MSPISRPRLEKGTFYTRTPSSSDWLLHENYVTHVNAVSRRFTLAAKIASYRGKQRKIRGRCRLNVLPFGVQMFCLRSSLRQKKTSTRMRNRETRNSCEDKSSLLRHDSLDLVSFTVKDSGKLYAYYSIIIHFGILVKLY